MESLVQCSMEVAKIFKTIQKIAKKERVEVYVVGGYVRDCLLGIEQNKDIDFVVIGSGLKFARAFDKEMKESFGSAQDKAGSLVEFPDFDTARYVITPPPPPSRGELKGGVGVMEL